MTLRFEQVGVAFAFVATDAASDRRADAEASLIARVLRSDADALGQLYDLHHVHVRAFAQRLIGDAAAAEDLVQDTFIALPQALAQFRGDSSLKTFLVSIAVNHARHHIRTATRRRAAHQRMSTEPPSSSRSPESAAEKAQLAATLNRALDELPIEQRVALVLCEVEERSTSEAAAIVGAPEGTVRTRIFHAKRKLREILAEEKAR